MAAKGFTILDILMENKESHCNIPNKKFKTKNELQCELSVHEQSIQHPVNVNNAPQSSQALDLTPSKQINKLNNVIILNFDDILFPTTKLKEILKRGTNGDVKPEYEQLKSLTALKITLEELSQFGHISYMTHTILLKYIQKYRKQNICIVSITEPNWIKTALLHLHGIGKYSDIYDLLFGKDKKCPDDYISIYHPSDDEYKLMHHSKHYEAHARFWTRDTFKHIFNEKQELCGNILVNDFVIIGHSSVQYEAAKKLNEYVKYRFCCGKNGNVSIDMIRLDVDATISAMIKALSKYL